MKHLRLSLPIILLFCLIIMSGTLKAQTNAGNNQTSETKNWLEMIQDPDVNFYEVQRIFNDYWKNRTDYKGNGWKVFKRWEYINETRVLPDGKLPKPDHLLGEYTKYMKKAGRSASGNWTIQGPTSYVGNNTSQPTGMGRINTIAFHPTDANTIYIGSPSGGFWKTTDGGASWTNMSSNLATLGVSSILIDPTDPNIIYLGSGDRDANDAIPLGVFKSTDGGLTFTQINNTMGNVTVGAMLMHPSDHNTILAATSGGIFKTTDGGATWSLKSGANNFKDIQFKPGDPNVVYAVRVTTPSRFYRSTNTGDTWTQITSGIPTSGIGSRMVIGVSPADPNYVYLVQINATGGTFAGLLRSTDAGLNFSTQSTSPNIFDYACDGSGTASQATYDLCITVDPSNANTIYVGSINNWKSSNGGVNWTISTHWIGSAFGNPCGASVHADQHCYAWSPHNGRLYVGHDGGINYTADGGATWPQITNNLAITQIYKIGQSATNSSYALFGCQDNGSAGTTNGSTFTTTRGGDGTECLIDYSNSNYCYNTYVMGDISRSTSGPTGSYSGIASTGTNGIGADESGAWVIPYFLHKTNPSVMFAGYENVFRCDNVKASPASSVNWSAISSGETTTCRVMEQSSANTDIVYVFRKDAATKLKRTDNANAAPASVTWSACNMPSGSDITDIKTHPTNPDIVYATAGAYIYKSTDRGMTWTDMDPNADLPALTINCLVYNKNSNEGIYVGNQTGVWYKDATMTSWVLFSTGLPPVDIRELEIYYDPVGTQHRLKAATYGRGLWQSDLYESGVLNPVNFTAVASSGSQIDLSWALSSGNNVLVAFSTSPTFGTPVNGTTYSTTIPGGGTVLYNGLNTTYNHTSLVQGTTYYYKIWSFDGSLNYSSGSTANATIPISVANFTSDISVSCTGSLTVNFTDASIGAWNSWAWDVDNNGTTDYTTQNPTHTYTNPGLYSVKLTIGNGASVMVKENLILVMSSEPTVNTGCTLSSNSNNGNGYGIGIYRFALGNIDNTTSYNNGYYQNYTCTKWTTLRLNSTYNITIQTGTANNEGAKVYLDFNDNGTFETGEAVVSFPSNKDGTRTLSFTTPSSGVVFDKGLRLRVLSKFGGVPSTACDISTYGQAEDYTVYFANQGTWDGDTSPDWFTAGNWTNGVVPATGASITIPTGCYYYPVLTSNVVCNNLTLNSGSSLTIISGVGLTVNGLLSNSAGNSGLVIESGGSIIEGNGVMATVKRDISGNVWHLISSPVNSATAGIFYDEFMMQHNTLTNQYSYITDQNFVLTPARGFALYADGTAINATFTGSLNTGAQYYSTLYGGSNLGYNLVGNPYPSFIDWDASSGWEKTNVENAIYLEKGETSWASYIGGVGANEGTRYIAPCQGFFVVANAAGSLGMTNSVRTHNQAPFFKSTGEPVPNLVRLRVSGNDFNDEAVVYIKTGTTNSFDDWADARKLFGSVDAAAQIYSLGDIPLSINAIPEAQPVPVGIKVGKTGTYTIAATEINNLDIVKLEDTKTGIITSLTEKSYTFNWKAGENENRFILHFATVDPPEKETSSIYSYDNTVFISLPAGACGDVSIYNLAGQIIASKTDVIGQVRIGLSTTGVYMVKVVTDMETLAKKVWIR